MMSRLSSIFAAKIVIALLLGVSSQQAMAAGWSWSLGYNNPPGATVGLNFMHLWSNWAFEVGIGAVQVKDENSTTNNEDAKTLQVAGDVDLKYLFGSGWFRPYLQGGMGAGIGVKSGDETSAGAGIGGGYFGGGIFMIGNPFYLYASYNSPSFAQVGIGFGF